MKKAADRQDEKRVEQAFENVAVPENHKKTVHRQQQKKCAYQSGIQSDIVLGKGDEEHEDECRHNGGAMDEPVIFVHLDYEQCDCHR